MEGKLNHRVLPANKSAGVSTYDCIRRLKRVISLKKVGHAGSLDPFATGLVLLLTGEATKLSNYLMDMHKRYVADVKLGESTDTQDRTGRIVKSGDWRHIDADRIESVLRTFMGKRLQVPPMFSALKHQGKPLYTLARKGQRVERSAREVEVFEIKLLKCDLPFFRIEVFCSRGLYLRVLAEEIGEAMASPSHLYSLVRTRIGHFSLDSAVPDDSFETFLQEEEPGYSMSDALGHLPALKLTVEQCGRLSRGVAPRSAQCSCVLPAAEGSLVRLLGPSGELGGIGEVGMAGVLRIKRVFNMGG